MPKSGVKISGIAVIRIIVFIAIAYLLFMAYVRLRDFLLNDPIFTVKNVLVESSIQFIDTNSLKVLKGRNIFNVDIERIEKRLSAQYPQITHLRVVRELPDRIKVLAKRRDMLYQVRLKGKYLLVDAQGVAVIYIAKPINLVVVTGVSTKTPLKLGQKVSGVLTEAVAIATLMRDNNTLNKFKLIGIDVANPAKIIVSLADIRAKIILDVDHGAKKLNVLNLLLTQKKIDLRLVDYIDLRFEEPVIAAQPIENE